LLLTLINFLISFDFLKKIYESGEVIGCGLNWHIMAKNAFFRWIEDAFLKSVG